MIVSSAEGAASGAAPVTPSSNGSPQAPAAPDRQQSLKEQALADSGVQALLDVFAAEIKDVEEM
jgi:hypothetical protein